MSMYNKIIYNGRVTKLEVFEKDHPKFSNSLLPHKKALEYGLRLPNVYKIEEIGNKIYKYTEWVSGNTIQHEIDKNKDMVCTIGMKLGIYMAQLYHVAGVTPVDCHFLNFVWHENIEVVYIDLKKLFFENIDSHIEIMSKLCLKSCRGNRDMTVAILKGYNKYRDVTPIIGACCEREWKWKTTRGDVVYTSSIMFEDLNDG